MRKVVVNTCYGGFGLSSLAVKKIFDLKHPDEKYFVYIENTGNGRHFPHPAEYNKVTDEKQLEHRGWDAIYVTKTDFGDTIHIPMSKIYDRAYFKSHFPNTAPELVEQYFEAADFWKKNEDQFEYIEFMEIPRHDPDLIKVVEELGKDSWGPCSELTIKEIDDDERYIIDEYDGLESLELESQCCAKKWQ